MKLFHSAESLNFLSKLPSSKERNLYSAGAPCIQETGRTLLRKSSAYDLSAGGSRSTVNENSFGIERERKRDQAYSKPLLPLEENGSIMTTRLPRLDSWLESRVEKKSARGKQGENVPPVTPSPPRTLPSRWMGGVNERKVESSRSLSMLLFNGNRLSPSVFRKVFVLGEFPLYLRWLIQLSSSGYYCDCSVIYNVCDFT